MSDTFYFVYHPVKGWRVVRVRDQRDICGAVDGETARRTAGALDDYRSVRP